MKTKTLKKPIISNYYNTKMTKELTLTISERYAALNLLNVGKFSTTELLGKVLDDIKKISISEEEWTKANLKKTPTDEEVKALPLAEQKQVSQIATWTNEGNDKTVELDSAVVEYLLAAIKDKEEKKEITMADVPLVTLKAKL